MMSLFMMSSCLCQINHVVQYDFPTSVTDYLHRVGRTGRVGGVTQCLATTFMTKKKDVRVALKIEVHMQILRFSKLLTLEVTCAMFLLILLF